MFLVALLAMSVHQMSASFENSVLQCHQLALVSLDYLFQSGSLQNLEQTTLE